MRHKIIKNGFFLKFIFYLAFVLALYCVVASIHYLNGYSEQHLYCYDVNESSLKNILQSSPPPGRSIFFHETSCNSHKLGKIVLQRRQACAVESAAKLHLNRSIYLLLTSPGVIKDEGTESDRFIHALLTYKNIHIRHVRVNEYVKGTPAEKFYRDGPLKNSPYAQSHASDLLRYLTLWKFGGIYLDLDVVVIKSFDNLTENFSGAESENNVAAGVMGFSHQGFGHELATFSLNDFVQNYKYDDWGYNGPGVITRLSRKLCGKEKAIDMIAKDCNGLTVYNSSYFYPIHWQHWRKYFDEDFSLKYFTKSYAIHVWNKHSTTKQLTLNSTAPYLSMARKFCPKVLSQCDNYF